MKKQIPVLLVIFLSLYLPLAHAQSQIDLNTYYISPYGSYFAIRLYPRAEISAACDHGSFYVNDDENCRLQYCLQSGQWGLISGVWLQDTNNDYIYPIDWATADVGIGEQSPGSKLHIKDNATPVVAAILTIKSAAGDEAKLLLDGSSDSSLEFDAQNDLNLITSDESLRFYYGNEKEASDKEIFTYTSGKVGIQNTTPDAQLEISGTGGLTSDLMEISGANFYAGRNNGQARIGINESNPDAPLEINSSAGQQILFLHETAVEVEDMSYGNSGDARFVHTGAASGELHFVSSAGANLAKLNNSGQLHIRGRLGVDSFDENVDSSMKIHERKAVEGNPPDAADPFWLFSDQNTNTSVDRPTNCPYIETDVIGVLTSTTSADGGMTLLGIGKGAARTAALRLAGVVPDAANNAAAVNIGGLHGAGSITTPAIGESHTILRVNYATSSKTNFSVFNADGHWGIGLNAGDSQPNVMLHIHDVMKLEPIASPPSACIGSREGQIYVDSTDPTLCLCDGTEWLEIAGDGECL